MLAKDVLEAVLKDFDLEVAGNVLIIHSVHLGMKIKDKDLTVKGNFTKRLTKKAKELLWWVQDEDFDLAFKLAMSLHSLDIQ
jgi:hypothetical protein